MNDTNVETIKKKVQFFLDNKTAVHVDYKNGYWKNGYVLEISADFFMLDEFKDGQIPVFYQEILEVEIFTVKNEVRNGAGKRS